MSLPPLAANIITSMEVVFSFFHTNARARNCKKLRYYGNREMQMNPIFACGAVVEQLLTLHLHSPCLECILIRPKIAAFGVALPSRASESGGNKECRAKITSR
ncbi:uncharacterized protein LOC116840401 isoform X2 [Odontomachus brunneus]|nr:uncharacterized protein LOC116840401 isoform X2 [Odontomachus brunneus]